MSQESADRVASLLDGWRTLSRGEQAGDIGFRTWNRLVDQLNRIAEAAVADPAAVRALTLVAERDEDPAVRRSARQVVRPCVPRPDADRDLERWLTSPRRGTTANGECGAPCRNSTMTRRSTPYAAISMPSPTVSGSGSTPACPAG